jgi:LysR family transcriptional regulator, hydrogen peroxide-inducible genes activator
MSELSLKHLRYFLALAQHRHFGRAAESCSISQPALSVQVKELEGILGAPLVERTARLIHLTGLGELVAIRARDILQSTDELSQLASSTGSSFVGKLRIGAIPTVAPYLLPKVVKSLRQRFPELEIRPREAVTQKLVGDILEARLDTAIVALPLSEPTLQETFLWTEEFVLVRPSEDAQKPVPSLMKLREMELLLLEEGHCLRDQALSFCQNFASAPRDLIEGSSLSTLVQMVGAGLGVTLIPEMAVPIETRSVSVSVNRLDSPRPSRTIGMIWRKTNPLSRQLEKIAETIRQSCLSVQS